MTERGDLSNDARAGLQDGVCPGCGVRLPDVEGPTHAYMESSPACWACYGDVLAREYGDAHYRAVHRLTVDAYAVQHPGRPSPQSIRSVAIHLISLCVVLEQGARPDDATRIIRRATAHRDRFEWLMPPRSRGAITIGVVHAATNAEEHGRLVCDWASSAWMAWSAHHTRIRTWLTEVCARSNSGR